ncbi:hypothetical protein PSTG_08768 [Puccinia striiformis f. sp. tritici PST-78]|uniref:OTU domain-containing protein n=1 Tax=Puccinia striiformis f. sp. tritici PST-78 TaxID=1165861 RepID=A0A0L0VFM2_9BASI|nr:hypothetical protein PSTG_08768 [Puccinia striiformis f. sp. tritici PST-78]
MQKEIPVSDEWVETESKEEEESDSSSEFNDDEDVNSQEWMILNQAHSSYTVVAKRIRRDVSQLHEVQSDGHCGFRAAAISMNQQQSEYASVRRRMVEEMESKDGTWHLFAGTCCVFACTCRILLGSWDLMVDAWNLWEVPANRCQVPSLMERQEIYKNKKYLAVVADEVPYNQILANLAYTASPCQMKHWIVFPRHGTLMADAFQRPVIHISNHIMTTYLPLSHGPTNEAPIFLVYLEGRYHYNPFQFSGSVYPAPPISQSWFKWRSNVARDWEAVIQLNREEWDQRFPVIPGITLNLEDGSSKD